MSKYILALCLLIIGGNLSSQSVYEYNFRVEGTCGMCKDRIESISLNLGKAQSATWNQETKVLTVEIEEPKYSILTIKQLLADAGHDNGQYIATDEVYQNLHECCKYRPSHDLEPVDTSIYSIENELEQLDSSHNHHLSGTIFGINAEGNKEALIGASVELINQEGGVITDQDGYFSIEMTSHSEQIRISYIGYESQVISVQGHNPNISITLADGVKLQEFEVVYEKKSTEISFADPLRVETITREELCKAACCNLSESFETNPSVDISYNDAVTGTSQIQMLGLAGQYVQICRELIPDVRGLNTAYGLNMTPGPWIESIQLVKGIGSVVNGYEGMAGQINVELKKSDSGEDFFLNGYANRGGRYELNTNFRKEINPNLSTLVLGSVKGVSRANDMNNDQFLDMPLENDFLFVNRWKFNSKIGLVGQLGAKISSLSHRGGSLGLYTDDDQTPSADLWSSENQTDRYELFGKLGYIFPENESRSIGFQWQYVHHDQEAIYGLRAYDANQYSIYGNLIFQNIFQNGHSLRAGLSYQQDEIEETISQTGVFDRKEYVPGIFGEFTYNSNKWTVIPGMRVDKHNLYGTFVIPRIHIKYAIEEQSVIRLAAGRGFKTASIFMENIGLFASSRDIVMPLSQADTPYGLEAEVAWNTGLSYTREWTVSQRPLIFTTDLFRTTFQNQVIVDFESAREVRFYNLDGRSFANSFQIKVDYELIPRLQTRVAYRLFDVKTDYQSGLLEKPLISKHRAFINLEYKTANDWSFDYTINWRGQKRLPSTQDNPVGLRREDYSPNYLLSNAQIMKRWGKLLDVYVGGENIFNYKQANAIIDAENPFSDTFDASMIWAPIFGANFYLGFRLNIGA